MSKALDKIIDSLKKKNGNLIGDEDRGKIKKVTIDSPQMAYLFGGGLPIGRIHRFRGPASQGKSTVSIYLASQVQKKLPSLLNNDDKKIVIYVDFERTFDSKYASNLGLDCNNSFIHLLPDDIETVGDTVTELVKSNDIAAIIYDSDAAAPSRAQMVDPSGKASFGGSARAHSELIRKLNILCANYYTSIFWISQERVNMNFGAHLPSVTGGESIAFFSSTINRVTKTDVIKNADETIGLMMRIRNYKNKCGVPFRDANVKLYYKGGFNPEEEYIDFLIKLDIIKQGGAWFSSEEFGFKLQGREKVQLWLDEHKDEYERLKKQVDETLTKESILDANRVMGDEEINESIDEEISDDILNDDE